MAASRGFDIDIPFVKSLGITLVQLGGGESELHYEARPEHLNSWRITHGGALMTLLDVTMAMAARSEGLQSGMGMVTVEMKTSFLRPATGRLAGRGKLLHRTRSLAFVQATVYNAEGQACCHATGTFKYLRSLAGGAGAPAS
ncbi:PaaI family thioesterase [Comamonas sp. NLF-1-9]|uniref:PaaI family thioesterase n=1 Tax=Comamonas sp. NLF-1-9 TaxID=2853163 RepID=UPI001C44FE73|nr:PaaI family thioesterase [Comamonas sp. NLF-1-9]QXL85611.1 PaaI family thioesterase [Comamonas sp. NLF-1-9]